MILKRIEESSTYTPGDRSDPATSTMLWPCPATRRFESCRIQQNSNTGRLGNGAYLHHIIVLAKHGQAPDASGPGHWNNFHYGDPFACGAHTWIGQGIGTSELLRFKLPIRPGLPTLPARRGKRRSQPREQQQIFGRRQSCGPGIAAIPTPSMHLNFPKLLR
jgi:hypothetical protein